MTQSTSGPKRRFDIAALAAIAIGLLLIAASFHFIGEISIGIRSSGWPSAIGAVVSHDARRGCSSEGGYAPTLVYRYAVAGRSYEGTLITATPRLCFDKESEARGFLGREYPLGAAVRAFYDPSAPDSAVLQPGEYSRLGFALVPAMWLMALALIYAGWKTARQGTAPHPAAEAAPAAVQITLQRKGAHDAE